MGLQIIKTPIFKSAIPTMTQWMFGDMIKAVVDVEKERIALDMELHADGETLLLENGSQQKNLWGINLYFGRPKDQWIEFDSMVNIRPAQGNRSRGVENPEVQQKIILIVNKLIQQS